MTPTIRAARAYLASPRAELRPLAHGRADALGLRASRRTLRRHTTDLHPCDPQPAPLIGPADPIVTLAEYHAVADAYALGLPAPRGLTRTGTARLIHFPERARS